MKTLENIMKQMGATPIRNEGGWTYRWNMEQYVRDPYEFELWEFIGYIG